MAQNLTPAKRNALVAKALKAESKSEGMRMLFDAGFRITEVRDAFGVGYAFVYGVALRHGVAMSAADRRAPTKSVATPVSKASPKASAKTSTRKGEAVASRAAKVSRQNAREVKATPAARTPRARSQVLAVAKPGRPSAARRQANRKPAKA